MCLMMALGIGDYMYSEYVEKSHSWDDNWNDVIRYVLFKDDKLKELMCIPKDCTIIDFVDKYFIEDGSGTDVLTDEAVRIIYYDEPASGNDPHVHHMYKTFLIYVNKDVLRTATEDRLQTRYDLIANRLKYLLLGRRYVQRMRYTLARDTHTLWTKAMSYRVARISFAYTTTI